MLHSIGLMASNAAKLRRVPYQRTIRTLVDAYAKGQKGK